VAPYLSRGENPIWSTVLRRTHTVDVLFVTAALFANAIRPPPLLSSSKFNDGTVEFWTRKSSEEDRKRKDGELIVASFAYCILVTSVNLDDDGED
jgi:hypothetical protein